MVFIASWWNAFKRSTMVVKVLVNRFWSVTHVVVVVVGSKATVTSGAARSIGERAIVSGGGLSKLGLAAVSAVKDVWSLLVSKLCGTLMELNRGKQQAHLSKNIPTQCRIIRQSNGHSPCTYNRY
jgi:hypothetical protein